MPKRPMRNRRSLMQSESQGRQQAHDMAKQSWGQGALWTSLAQFSPRIREMWKARIDRLNPGGYGYGRSMICYLLATSRPITWTPRHTKE